MRKKMAAILLVTVSVLIACTSARGQAGPKVDVYEVPASASPVERRLPEGCRLLATSGPIDQMESERAMNDPYRAQRAAVAEKGGNVLLVLSERTVTRPNLECPSGDASADCLQRGQSWYRVSFEHYACNADALAELKTLPPPPPTGGITLLLSSPKKTKPAPTLILSPATPSELKTKVLEMMRESVASDVILAYVNGQRLSRKMTAEEIIDWTKSGIPDSVIEAAASR